MPSAVNVINSTNYLWMSFYSNSVVIRWSEDGPGTRIINLFDNSNFENRIRGWFPLFFFGNITEVEKPNLFLIFPLFMFAWLVLLLRIHVFIFFMDNILCFKLFSYFLYARMLTIKIFIFLKLDDMIIYFHKLRGAHTHTHINANRRHIYSKQY